MAADKRRAFALKKADQAVADFGQAAWASGLPKSRAALELLEGAKGLTPRDTSLLCGGVCVALAACNRVGEALRFFGDHSTEIGDEFVKDRLLEFWMSDANAPVPGDLVQLSGSDGAHLVGTVLRPTPSGFSVRVLGTAADVSAADGPVPEALAKMMATSDGQVGEELEVAESDVTVLTLRLSEEQRCHWRSLREERPELFGERMKSDNEARWQRLFGAAARSQSSAGAGVAGGCAGAAGAAEDLGLPLEQSFVATLYGLITDCLERIGDPERGELVVDLLGARPALELDDPEPVLKALLRALPQSLRRLTVRMCGPEVGCEAYARTLEAEPGRSVELDVRPGLYHRVVESADAELVVAMNAGIGVPQYTGMWGPTLDALASRPRRTLFAVTSYSPGEVVREERLLRQRWACGPLSLGPDNAELAEALSASAPPWTLDRELRARTAGGEVLLRRGDLVLPAGRAPQAPGDLPQAVRVARGTDLAYVGPNRTPGRSRNYGLLVLWVGGGAVAAAA